MVTLILRSLTLVWASFMKRRISTLAPEFLKPCELPFFFERCYVYNIFTTNHRCLVVIGSNFKLTLRLLFFFPTITTSNNLPFRICCKNVVDISFLFFFCSLFTIFCLSFFFFLFFSFSSPLQILIMNSFEQILILQSLVLCCYTEYGSNYFNEVFAQRQVRKVL